MKKRLLGIGIIVLEFLIGSYWIIMIDGWDKALRILGAIGLVLGTFIVIVITVVTILFIVGDNDDDGEHYLGDW